MSTMTIGKFLCMLQSFLKEVSEPSQWLTDDKYCQSSPWASVRQRTKTEPQAPDMDLASLSTLMPLKG